jgi:hypothetical protein
VRKKSRQFHPVRKTPIKIKSPGSIAVLNESIIASYRFRCLCAAQQVVVVLLQLSARR